MAKRQRLEVEYAPNALKHAQQIVAYLRQKFSEKEVTKFYRFLNDFEQIIVMFPTLYSESLKKNVRKAVLSHQLSLYYSVKNNKINVVAILDNRWEQSRKLK
jgi:plasmid stabilization system protein ParE